MGHLGMSVIAALCQGSLAPQERKRAVRHLLSGCPRCLHRLKEAGSPSLPPPIGDDYDASLDRGLRAARRLVPRLREDEQRVERGLAILRERGNWTGSANEIRPFQGRWTKIEAQLRRSFELRYSDPKEMLILADGAVKQAEIIQSNAYGEGFLFDLRARAWAELANACRVNEDYERAESALVKARERWAFGSGDPALQARIDDFEASLRLAQRHFDDALRLLGKVHRAYLRLGDRHLAGRALLNKSNCLALALKENESVEALRNAISLLDEERDLYLFSIAHQNLLDALVDAGHPGEAGRILLESGLRQKLAGDPLNLLRVRWVEAKLLAARDRLEDAERAFEEVRGGFHEQGLAYDEALAGLDLAVVLLRRGKEDEVHGLALQLHSTFVERKIHPEATLALTIFEVSCRRREATVALAQTIRQFLADLKVCPSLRLEFR